ncbi:uncharacterized protein LOC127868184 [Dreissena polymorpha]|uniref:uncharacterized protein LOC127868184 n=1 Tax=Dreissena polymorpha TaxID=45954 RepID=UPI002264D097|nr:uncharacterized protein LOC127868184 [Dreissena polymorpha]
MSLIKWNLRAMFIIILSDYNLGQMPVISLKHDGLGFNAEISCFSLNPTMGTVRFYENNETVIEIRNSRSGCEMRPDNVPNKRLCGCKDLSTVACNISLEFYSNECKIWMCEFIERGRVIISDSVNVCSIVRTSSVTRSTSERNCSSLFTTEYIVDWFVDGVALNIYSDVFKMRTYNAKNISLLMESFYREGDGSIVTCKVDEPAVEEWTIKILYPTALCTQASTLGKEMTAGTICKFTHGNPNITAVSVPDPSCQHITTVYKPEVYISLCDAVNRVDLGARRYVGNISGLFKSELLYPASILDYHIDEIHTNAWNVTSEGKRYIRFNCHGDGNPPPIMKLIKENEVLVTTNTSFQHKMTFKNTGDVGMYMCVASNVFGSANKAIYVHPLKIDSQKEDFPSMTNMIVYVVSGIVTLALVILGVQRLCRIFRCSRPSPPEIVRPQVVFVNIANPEQTNEQTEQDNHTTDLQARRNNSVHLYECIPPSPIADISFGNIGDDTEFIEVGEPPIADAGRYESLDQRTREFMTYSSNPQDPNTREVMTYNISPQEPNTHEVMTYSINRQDQNINPEDPNTLDVMVYNMKVQDPNTREFMTYNIYPQDPNINLQDPNTQDVMTYNMNVHDPNTRGDTSYINLQL